MIAAVLLVGLLAVAAGTDLLRRKIYNWTVYPGILAAWGLNAAGTLWLWASGGDEAEEWLRRQGWVGLADSFAGFMACGLVLVACYLWFKVGGGDVKLMAMMGAWLGTRQGLEAMLWTFVLAAAAAAIVLIWKVGPGRMMAFGWRQLRWLASLGRFSPLKPEEWAELQPPLHLAPAALAAAIVVEAGLAEWLR